MDRMSGFLERNARNMRRGAGLSRPRRGGLPTPSQSAPAPNTMLPPSAPGTAGRGNAPAQRMTPAFLPPQTSTEGARMAAPPDVLADDHILELPPRRATTTSPASAASVPDVAPSSSSMASLREVTHEYLARMPRRSPAHTVPLRPDSELPEADVCSVCGGAGFVRADVPLGDPMFGQAIACECKEREREERRLSELRQLSSLNPFKDKTFDNFDCMGGSIPSLVEAYEVARAYTQDPRGWLLFMGGYGVGKTHLAAAIANHFIAQGRTVFFSIVPDLLQHLRSAFAPNSETTYDAMFDKIRESYLLVLDDLGAENSTAWATEKLFQLINYRYNYGFLTVITTNHRQFSHLDERISSRLSDVSLVRQIAIDARDYRKLPRHGSSGGALPNATPRQSSGAPIGGPSAGGGYPANRGRTYRR